VDLRALLLTLFALASCAGGSPPAPVYGPPLPPAPIVTPRPGSPVLVADWTSPLGAAMGCGTLGHQSPFECVLPPSAKWGVIPGMDDCVSPEPTRCFQPAGGWLGFTAPGGMALVSATTLDRARPMSLRGVVRIDRIDCSPGVAYAGIVDYGGGDDDGDPTGNYRALYISCFAGDTKVRLWLYEGGAPAWAGPIWDFDFRDGQAHELGIDWFPGDRVDYLLDGAVVFTEGQSFGHSPLTLNHDPHPALWFGSAAGAIGRFDATGGP
jgi:hypothetical protein